MKKKLFVVFLLIVIGCSFTACTPSLKILGKWNITEYELGNVKMDKNDAEDMGSDLGFIKINKSGSCVVNFLGDEYEGKWTGTGTDNITANTNLEITYGDNQTATASFEGDTMIVTDSQDGKYSLEK